MSDQLYEIAFSGEIVEGADLETVKLHLGRIFKADEQRLAHMFSGRRVLIKRQADAATAAKYRGAFEKVGAICEVRPLDEADNEPAAAGASQAASQPESTEPYQARYPESEVVPQALLSVPLAVDGQHIEDLQTDLAPVGSPLQYSIDEPVAPEFDLSGLDMAPVGSNLSNARDEPPPALPDTSGLTVADLER